VKTVDVTYAGKTVALPDLPDYRKFYGKLAAGVWEPHTFEVLKRNLDRETTYVDIGAWIGVTPFWASGKVKSVIAVEPDPKCGEILDALGVDYPDVTILHGALSPDPRVTIHAVGEFGSSETSILDIGDGETAEVPGLRLDDVMRLAGTGPVFVKIDIEGYEFRLEDEIAGLRTYPLRGLQLAVHPQLLERTLSGVPAWRRLKCAWRVWRLSRVLTGKLPPPTLAKFRGIFSYLLFGIVFKREPRGADLVFEVRRFPGAGSLS
jgi:FkbM family methyltransferase